MTASSTCNLLCRVLYLLGLQKRTVLTIIRTSLSVRARLLLTKSTSSGQTTWKLDVYCRWRPPFLAARTMHRSHPHSPVARLSTSHNFPQALAATATMTDSEGEDYCNHSPRPQRMAATSPQPRP